MEYVLARATVSWQMQGSGRSTALVFRHFAANQVTKIVCFRLCQLTLEGNSDSIEIVGTLIGNVMVCCQHQAGVNFHSVELRSGRIDGARVW